MNESRHVQLMYDKFRRYRKREEDKVAVREAEVKRAGNVDALEAKVQERGAQLSAVEREVVQKEKVSTGLDCTDWPKVGSRGRASLHAVCSVCLCAHLMPLGWVLLVIQAVSSFTSLLAAHVS